MSAAYLNTWKYGVGIVIVVVLLSLLSKTAQNSASGLNTTTKKQVKNLVKQAQHQKALALAQQDATLRLMYVTKALSMASIARKLATEDELQRLTQIDVSELMYELETMEAALVGGGASAGGYSGIPQRQQ